MDGGRQSWEAGKLGGWGGFLLTAAQQGYADGLALCPTYMDGSCGVFLVAVLGLGHRSTLGLSLQMVPARFLVLCPLTCRL